MLRFTSLVSLVVVAGCTEWSPPRAGLNEETQLLIFSMALVSRPTDRSNWFLDRDDVAEFGQQLFFDTGLAAPVAGGAVILYGDWAMPLNGMSCADCHSPRTAFSDERPLRNVSLNWKGGWTKRNSTSLLNVATYTQFGWDGAADRLWVHSHTAYERTMGGDALRLVRSVYLRQRYNKKYGDLFEPLPSGLDPTDSEHAHYEPGGKHYDQTIQHYERLLKAMAAYMTRLESANSPFDRFALGDDTALSAQQRDGLMLFIGKAGCIECHSGSGFSDNEFHSVGIGQYGPNVLATDLGRPDGVSRYNQLVPYFDAGTPVAPNPGDPGLFRTKGLRNVSLTAPYMHAGQLATLRDVVWFYNVGGDREGAGVPSPQMTPLGLTEDEQSALVAFLEALTGDSPPRRWTCDNADSNYRTDGGYPRCLPDGGAP